MMTAKEMIEKFKEHMRDDQFRIYLTLGTAVFVALLYISILIVPSFMGFVSASKKANELSDKISRLNMRVKKLVAMDKAYKELKKEYGDYADLLPDEKEIPNLLEGLALVARDSNMSIKTIVPGNLATPKGMKYYSEIPVSLTAKSGYHQLGDFVSNLEKANRVISIKGIWITYDKKTPRLHNVKMALTVYVSIKNG